MNTATKKERDDAYLDIMIPVMMYARLSLLQQYRPGVSSELYAR